MTEETNVVFILVSRYYPIMPWVYYYVRRKIDMSFYAPLINKMEIGDQCVATTKHRIQHNIRGMFTECAVLPPRFYFGFLGK